MTSQGPYGDAFRQAKAQNETAKATQEKGHADAREKSASEAAEGTRLLSEVVLPELRKAATALKAEGGVIDEHASVYADGSGRPASVGFRVRDKEDWGRTSWFYVIRPTGNSVSVERTNTLDHFDKKRKSTNVSTEHGIAKLADLTPDKISKLILAAIKDYQSASPRRLD